MITSLSSLQNNQTATLLRVDGERSHRRRLLELGFVPGTLLRMVRRVEVGDILEVELRHSRVSLRLSEARSIEVDPLAGQRTGAPRSPFDPANAAAAPRSGGSP